VEKLGANLWSVEGTMPDGKTRRIMTLARMEDGRVVVHNAIALEEPEMKALEAWGAPSFIVVPNAFHRQDAKIWKQRYPEAKVLAPAGAAKGVSAVVKVEGSYDDGVKDAHVRLEHLAGTKDREGVMVVRTGDETTLVFNDAVLNMPPVGGPLGLLLAPTGRPSVPRIARWMLVKDKNAFRTHVERLATPDVKRVIVGHGKPLTVDPSAALRDALTSL